MSKNQALLSSMPNQLRGKIFEQAMSEGVTASILSLINKSSKSNVNTINRTKYPILNYISEHNKLKYQISIDKDRVILDTAPFIITDQKPIMNNTLRLTNIIFSFKSKNNLDELKKQKQIDLNLEMITCIFDNIRKFHIYFYEDIMQSGSPIPNHPSIELDSFIIEEFKIIKNVNFIDNLEISYRYIVSKFINNIKYENKHFNVVKVENIVRNAFYNENTKIIRFGLQVQQVQSVQPVQVIAIQDEPNQLVQLAQQVQHDVQNEQILQDYLNIINIKQGNQNLLTYDEVIDLLKSPGGECTLNDNSTIICKNGLELYICNKRQEILKQLQQHQGGKKSSKNKNPKIFTGPKGGKYILKNNKKVYLTKY